jgi:hypothetical protein
MLIYDFAIYSLQVQIAKLAAHYSLSRKQQGLMFNNSKLVTDVQVISFPAQRSRPNLFVWEHKCVNYVEGLSKPANRPFLNWIYNNSNLFYVTKF